MPPPAQEPPAAPAARPVATPFSGARWAVVLGGVLLALLSLATAWRRLTPFDPPAGERVVQLPLPADGGLAPPRPDRSAPDPGD